MMLRKRVNTWLLLGVVALTTASQAVADYAPSELSLYVGDAQPFRKFDLSTFDRRPYANEGFFLTFDEVRYVISAPKSSAIGGSFNSPVGSIGILGGGPQYVDPLNTNPANGFPPVRPANAFVGTVNPLAQFNSMGTGLLTSTIFDGNDTTVGYMHDNCGWFVRIQDLNARNQYLTNSDVGVIFNDPQNLLIGFYDKNGDGTDDDLNGNGHIGRDGPVVNLLGVTPAPGSRNDRAEVDQTDIVPLGILFDSVNVRNSTRFYFAEANRSWRYPREHCGGFWEVFGGMRYMDMRGIFRVDATGSFIDETMWNTTAENRIVAPQLGARWFKRTCRWSTSFTGRLIAGANFQSIKQQYSIGEHLSQIGGGTVTGFPVSPATGGVVAVTSTGVTRSPTGGTDIAAQGSLMRSRFDAFSRQGGNHYFNDVVFVPAVEVGFNTSFNITSAFALRAGVKALYMYGIARPSNMVAYNFPDFGILQDYNKQDVFMYGVNLGFEFNR